MIAMVRSRAGRRVTQSLRRGSAGDGSRSGGQPARPLRRRRSCWVVSVVVAGSALLGCGADDSSSARLDARAETLAANRVAMWQRYGRDVIASLSLTGGQADVLAAMIAHHQDAITGSAAFLTAHESVQAPTGFDAASSEQLTVALATRIERVQTDQVNKMQTWLDERGAPTRPGVWEPMFDSESSTATVAGYLTTMMEHHHHAVMMYQTWASSDVVIDTEVGLMLRSIAKGQEGEMAMMCQLLGSTPGADPNDVRWCHEVGR